jgi:urease beta subunit
VRRCDILYNGGNGIYTLSNITILGNRIQWNRGSGIYATASPIIQQNNITNNTGDGIYSGGNSQIMYNDITYNGGDGIETAGLPLVNYNNIFGNVGYDFRATKVSPDSINARYNWWGTTDRDSIAGKIYDYYDDGQTVKVRFEPYYSSFVEMVPVSGFRAVGLSGGRVRLSWDRNSFASRYRIYWDNGGGVIDTVNVWVELDSSYTSYEAVLVDGLYRFGIVAVSYDGRRSIMVVDSVVADGTAPRLVYAFGVSGDSTISVKFSEVVDYSSIADTSKWVLSSGLRVRGVIGSNVLQGLRVDYYNDTSRVGTPVRVDTLRSGVMSFYWGWGSPVSGVNSDYFRVVYSGYVLITEGGSYEFSFEKDYESRVIIAIDDTFLLDYSWNYSGSGVRNLGVGYHKVRVEYIEFYGESYFRFYWKGSSGVREEVSASLFSLRLPSDFELRLTSGLPLADSLVSIRVSGVRDLYGNTSGELRYDFYPDDGNSNPVVELISRIVESSSDIRVDYRISDVEGDVVRIRVEYSIDGGRSWRVGSVVGDTVDIGRDRYVGYIVWRSGVDLPGYDGEVIFRVTPRDNDPHNWGTPGEIRFRVDNYQRQKIKIALVDTVIRRDSVVFSYEITDSTGDVIHLRGYYRVGASGWREARIKGVSDSLGVSDYRGLFVWDAFGDLDEGYFRDVSFKVEPWDQWGLGFVDSLVGFEVNNARRAVVKLVALDTVGSGDIRFRYSFVKSFGNSVVIDSVVYSVNRGMSWARADVEYGDSMFVWRSGLDLMNFEGDSVYVKMLVHSYGGESYGVVDYVVVDNRMPIFYGLMSVELDSFKGVILRWGRAKDISSVRYRVYVREELGSYDFNSWFAETGDTVLNVSGLRNFRNYYFLVRAVDRFGHLDTNTIEGSAYVVIYSNIDTVKIVDAVAGKRVRVVYRLNASSDDTISLRFEYSFDDENWGVGRGIIGRVDSIVANVGVYVDTLLWVSYEDVGYREGDSLRVRIIPYGRGGEGRMGLSRRFMIDNKSPRFLGIRSVEGDSSSAFLRWERGVDRSDTIWYMVYVGGDSVNLFKDFSRRAEVIDTFYRVLGLENFKDYYFGVRARDWAGNVDSNFVYRIGRPVHYARGYVFGLDTIVGRSYLRYSIVAVREDSGYVKFYYSVDGGRDWVLIDSVRYVGMRSDSLLWDSGVGLDGYESDSLRIKLVVRGRGGVDREWISDRVAIDNKAPMFSGLAYAIGEERRIRLIWNRARDISPVRYYIYMRASGGNFDFGRPYALTSDTFYVVNGLTPGERYYFVVRAVDRYGHIDSNFVERYAIPYQGLLGSFGLASHHPGVNELNVDVNDSIYVRFLDDVIGVSDNSFIVLSSYVGRYRGRLVYYSDSRTAVFKPNGGFRHGDVVSVVLNGGIRFISGDSIKPYIWTFTVGVKGGTGNFVEKTRIGVGSNPYGVSLGDIDGDGDLDIAVTNPNPDNISILINNGSGSFTIKGNVYVGVDPYGISFGDIDGDGDLDIAVANYGSNNVSILANDGSGNFTLKGNVGVGSNPRGISLGDIDGDGDLDIAVANYGSNNVSILINDGSGNFTLKGNVGVGSNPRGISLGDIDGDGDLDIAVANYGSNNVSILINDGSGNFTLKGNVGVGSYPYGISFGDIDGDGDLDIAVANWYSNNVSILANDGSGNFTLKGNVDVGSNPVGISFGDIDGDGDLDIAVANLYSNNVSILVNDGSGNFTLKGNVGVGSGPWGISFGDIDGDGDIDIAVTNYGSNNISILKNRNSSADITLSSLLLSFGDVSVGGTRSLYLRIYNDGVDSALVGRISLSDGRSFSLSKNSFSIPGLGVDSVLVSFSPVGYGNWVDTLIIESNDPVKPRLFVKLVGYSGNYVSGVITSDAVWRRDNSPYIISGNVGVDAGVRLRIEPGVVVVFKGRYSILVDGRLEVYGAEGDSVLFTSLYPDTIRGDWIYFRSGSRGDINYAIFEYGNTAIRANGAVGIEVRGSRFSFNGVGMADSSVSSVLVSGVKFSMNGTGLSLYNSGVNVEGSEFRGNSTGISIGGGSVVISGSRIVGNSGYGVYNGNGNGNVKVIGSELVGNGTGFYNSWGWIVMGWIDIYGNVVRGNVGWGFELHTVSGSLRRNVIEGNGGGVWVDNNVEISDNVIVRNRGRGVYVDGGVNVLRNRVSLNFDDGIYSGGNSQIKYNDITYNGGDGIETAGLPLVNYNNIFGNAGYDFRATKVSPDSINARYNWWGTTDRDSIAGKIYDYYDDGQTVKVRFEPYYSSFVEMVPVSGFRAVGLSGGRVRLSWDRNSFASRYRIYWDNGGGVIDTVNVWVELDSSYTSYEAVLVDGLYKFGIVAVSYDGRRSIMVVDSVVADGTAPRLVYAFGVSGDSTISVKFSEPVKYDIVSDTGRWEFWGGIKVKSVSPKFVKGLEVSYYNGHDFKNLVRKDTIRSGNMSFDWGYGSPASGVSSDTFSVRFSGYVYIPVSGSYNFYVECNDRVNLIIGKDTLMYGGRYGSYVNMSFSPGLYRFIFEFFEDYDYAYFRLYWTVPGGSRVLMSVDNFMVDVDFSAYNLKLARVLPVADTLVYVKVRGVEDLYGNRAGELRYDFYPDDGNSNPVVELISRIVEASSDIRVDYRISDVEGDVVRIRVEYSIDGGSSWRVASVVGDTVNIGRDRYVGYIVWRSGLDLPGYDGEVIFRVTPRDNDPHNWGTPGEIRFRVDNYQRQKIKIALVDTLFEYSDSVKISYLIEDSTKDVLEIKVFYVKGLDSARVGSIGGVPSKVDSSRYRGTFIWLSKKDLDGFDGNVKLYVYASDGWGNGLGDSLSFKLDNNEIPSIAIAPIGEEVNDSVRIRYVLTDREGDTLRISFEYSLDSLRWRRGKVLGDTIIPASGYASNIIWLSRSDLPGVDDIVYVKITPFDNDTGRAGVISIHLDNNYPPVAKIDSISGLKRRTGAYRGDISFSFNLRDAEGDSVKIYFKFRYDSPDSIWRVATASGVQRVVAPGVYSGVWHTTDGLPFASGRYVFGIFPEDKDAGVYDSVIVNVDNIGVPAVISLSIFDTSKIEFSGNITFNYRVIDEEGDTIRLKFDYSVDGGRSWRKATVLGDTILSDSSRYVGSIIWRSEADLWGVDVDSVLFRLTPYDRNMGLQYISKPFHLDNNEPPRVVMTRLVGEQSDSVRISFNVGDRERDSVMLVYEYSVDGRDWRRAKVVGYNSVDSSRYSGVAIWLSRVDLPDVDLRVYFRITPYDKDRGIGDSIYFSLDNYQGQKILISLVDSSPELSDSVKIRYTVIDATKDTLQILGRYSIDGVNWKYMTLSGSLGVIDTSRYNGVIVWLSKVDLPFYDGLVTLRFDISDGWGFGKGDSVKFHLDNNEPPRITYIETPKVEVVGSYPMKFISWDREGDTVKFIYEFMVEGDTSWRKATAGNLSKVGDTTIVIWRTDIDLFNRDVYVYFKVTPMDNDTGKAMTTGRFKVDNQTGPILISSSPLNVAFYNDTIVFKFDRKVRYNSVVSALNITGTRTGVHSFSITPSVDDSMFYVVAQPFFASAETVLISLSGDFANGVKDLLGNSLDGNKNGDPEGSPDDDIKISFITSLLGDFNLDRRVNLSDLNEFRKVWNGQIRHREIGPALGKPPQMIPQPDGKVDFEDLMVFVMNWNWTTRSGGFKLASKFGITDNGAGIASISLPIENKKGDVISAKFDEEMVKLVKLRNKNEYIRVGEVENDLVTYKVALSFPDSITALEVVLRYNPGILRVLEVKDLKAFDLVNGGRNVFLSYIDSVNGLIVVDVANFGKIDKVGEIEIASLTFSTQTKDETDVCLLVR